MNCVLDASAVLALVLDEGGADSLRELVDGATISSVNLHEVLVRIIDEDSATARKAMDDVIGQISVMAFDLELARTAADLRATTRAYGLSLGDRACLAQGIHAKLPILTGDRRQHAAGLHLGIDIVQIR